MTPDEELDRIFDETPVDTFDMNAVTPQEHRFDRIIGNQLQCSLHENCVGMFIKPWEVLERNEAGDLILVDKRPV